MSTTGVCDSFKIRSPQHEDNRGPLVADRSSVFSAIEFNAEISATLVNGSFKVSNWVLRESAYVRELRRGFSSLFQLLQYP